MRRLVRRVLAAAAPLGELQMVERLARLVPDTGSEALVVLGSLAPRSGTTGHYRQLFKTLAEANLPTFYVPGPDDAPVQEYLQEAYNIEIVYPFLHGVHGTFAFGPGHVLFAGMGGEILDDPETRREERERLCYPAWEVEYRFKVLQELKDYQKVFLFTTAPEHKGLHERGSAVLAEMIKSYKPRLVLLPGTRKHERLGSSLLVMPGRLSEGDFVVVDLREEKIEVGDVR